MFLRAIVLGYYAVLRQTIRQSGGRLHLYRCVECGIFFPTKTCNRMRDNLRCPFGCRGGHARRQGVTRSRRHNTTEEGRKSKRGRNQRYYYRKRGREVPTKKWREAPEKKRRKDPGKPVAADSEALRCMDDLDLQDKELAMKLAPHVRDVLWGVTGHWASLGRVLELLAKRLRRRGVGRSGRMGYYVRHLRQNPP